MLIEDQHSVEFRAEIRAFLDVAPSEEILEAGRKTTSVFAPFKETMAWHKILFRQGWVAPTWPLEYGGTGWTVEQRYIFAEECNRRGVPPLLPQNLQMVGPAVLGFGTQEQKEEFLPGMLSGEDFWCQGYSEPGAGSDLAALKCRADSDGDDYILNGSKTWTTYGHHANKMFALVRTSSAGKPQAGITFLLLDMNFPGIEVRPIVGLDGCPEQCEVFFSDVRVPKRNRIGEENKGWNVAKYVLEFERGGSSFGAWLVPALEKLRARSSLALDDSGRSVADDVHIQRRLTELEIDVRAVEHTEKRVNANLKHGENPGPMASLLKIISSEVMQKFSELQLDIVGLDALPLQTAALAVGSDIAGFGEESDMLVMPYYLNTRAASIYAGSNEVQRSLLAKAILAS
ncbi:alkylation response protein AidB-like acyl-CoA dehydrogenase [Zhongshania antarctica]|uniref:Alkylation response protein AidB-like acyl-CoA dehydrogenase n=1 Tax=Zhongshania antarctica TaxID=641702 RepID=A0A840R009_9GAMM|nr:acyl-CoA dehydrogenase family protein [Zhongshania antarctica]MBB5185914.1 alkylation response protein AidB-like acyl-CoA dehydrogenase [Zhongshania antarctica]